MQVIDSTGLKANTHDTQPVICDGPKPKRLEEQMRDAIAVRHYSLLAAGCQRVIAPDALDAGSAGLVSVSRQFNTSICALAEQLGEHCCGGTGGLALAGSGRINSDGTTSVRGGVEGDAQPAASSNSGNSSGARDGAELLGMVRSFGLGLSDAALVQASALAGLRGRVCSLLPLGGDGGLQCGQRRIRPPQAPRLRAQQGQGSGQGQREH